MLTAALDELVRDTNIAGGEIWIALDPAGIPVSMPCGGESAVRPQSDLCVTFVPRKTHALIDKSGAESKSARFRVDQQQAQARYVGLVVFHQHDTADILAAHLGDPAALAPGIKIVDEVGDDLRAQPLERIGPAVFAQIQLGVARHDPAEVAGARLAQGIGRTSVSFRRGRTGQQCLDCVHG